MESSVEVVSHGNHAKPRNGQEHFAFGGDGFKRNRGSAPARLIVLGVRSTEYLYMAQIGPFNYLAVHGCEFATLLFRKHSSTASVNIAQQRVFREGVDENAG